MDAATPLLFQWRVHLGFYIFLVLAAFPFFERFPFFRRPRCGVRSTIEDAPSRIFDCFLYHSEAHMLLAHLRTLSGLVDKFVIAYSNYSFAHNLYSPVSFAPFEREIMQYAADVIFLYVDFSVLPLSECRYRNGTAWKREATARNFLLEGVRRMDPQPQDIVLLCDVDEIVTRSAIPLIKARPPIHYYNLQGLLFHYSFRWKVGTWERPLAIRYGSIAFSLDDYKFMPMLFPLPGVLHYHCSFCFPTIAEIIGKLRSFSHTEYSQGKYRDPNYVYARVACGYGVLPNRWKMPERLTPMAFNVRDISLPDDTRFDFLRARIGFQDLGNWPELNISNIKAYMPRSCRLKDDPEFERIGTLM
jgi:hypothetical protein